MADPNDVLESTRVASTPSGPKTLIHSVGSSLENVRVAAPCTASWDRMEGDDRVRFCGQCQLNVYNLSAMSRGDAEHLVAEKEGRLCVRYYRRFDGKVLTTDCPVGVRALRQKIALKLAVAVGLVLSLLALLTGRSRTVGIHQGGRLQRLTETEGMHMGAPLPPIMDNVPPPPVGHTMGAISVSTHLPVKTGGSCPSTPHASSTHTAVPNKQPQLHQIQMGQAIPEPQDLPPKHH